jgi:hypothetical protein
MAFASAYLETGALFPEFIREEPAPDTGIIVVIPAYDEPEIATCLTSLNACRRPSVRVEVVIIVNTPSSAGSEAGFINNRTVESIESWKRENPNPLFRLYVFNAGMPSVKGWGVGAARKTGMDEAVRRFDRLGNPDGVILSLDADCEVDRGYLESVYDDFGRNRRAGGCAIYFEHREGKYPEEVTLTNAIRQYELHLRYYIAGLRWCGFPYPFHTVGSAFAVKAERYVKSGGMNRRQGGEDFYFIQKFVAGDDFVNLNTTAVYPSPRLSLRVPFGTGPVIAKLISGESAVNCGGLYHTYDPEAFVRLKTVFDMFSGDAPVARRSVVSFESVESVISLVAGREEWEKKYTEIVSNTSSDQMFTKRFFGWFNAFMIVKYLNNSHINGFSKVPINEAAVRMLRMCGHASPPESTEKLLLLYRELDRKL